MVTAKSLRHVRLVNSPYIILLIFVISSCSEIAACDPRASQELIQFSYRVQPGDEFKVRNDAVAQVWSEVLLPDRKRKVEKHFHYNYDALERIAAITPKQELVANIEPIPGSWRLLIDGSPTEVPVGLVPVITFLINPLGDFKRIETSGHERTLLRKDSLAKGLFDRQGLLYKFPGFIAEPIEIGARWRLIMPSARGVGEASAHFLGLDRYQGLDCAMIELHYANPIVIPKQLERSYEKQGMSVRGVAETWITECFGLSRGWPLHGNVSASYEATYRRHGKEFFRLGFHLNGQFNTIDP